MLLSLCLQSPQFQRKECFWWVTMMFPSQNSREFSVEGDCGSLLELFRQFIMEVPSSEFEDYSMILTTIDWILFCIFTCDRGEPTNHCAKYSQTYWYYHMAKQGLKKDSQSISSWKLRTFKSVRLLLKGSGTRPCTICGWRPCFFNQQTSVFVSCRS